MSRSITLRSTSYKNDYPKNNGTSFINTVIDPFYSKDGEFEIALTEIHFNGYKPGSTSLQKIVCNFVWPQQVGDCSEPVLEFIRLKHNDKLEKTKTARRRKRQVIEDDDPRF